MAAVPKWPSILAEKYETVDLEMNGEINLQIGPQTREISGVLRGYVMAGVQKWPPFNGGTFVEK